MPIKRNPRQKIALTASRHCWPASFHPARCCAFFLLSCLTAFIPSLKSQDLYSPDTLLSPTPGSQPPAFVTVKYIEIHGNKRTKNEIILRELDFSAGDTLSLNNLAKRIRRNELNILNTSLFLSASIHFKEWEGATNEVGLTISVKESWHIRPAPILELADRNFNVWWNTYNRSLQRINLGLRFTHANLSGRKDALKTLVQFGFTRKFEAIYTLPSFNKAQTLGLNLNFLHTREKEIGYNTLDNELAFFRDDNQALLRRLRLGAGLLYRPRFQYFHRLDLAWHDNRIDELVRAELNPNFFLDGLQQKYLALNYSFLIDKRDIRPYPMNGYALETRVQSQGLNLSDNINALNLQLAFQQYFSLSERASFGYQAKARAALIRSQLPYYNSQALGYLEDYIRGYEYYVVDGLDFGLLKLNFRWKLLDKELRAKNYLKPSSTRILPVKVFLSAHSENAYVYNPFYGAGNSLGNELLWGLSLGANIILDYDKVFYLEFSRNHFNEYGFFLHWQVRF